MAKLLRNANNAVLNADELIAEARNAVAKLEALIDAIRDGVQIAVIKTDDQNPVDLLLKPGPATLNLQLKIIIDDKATTATE